MTALEELRERCAKVVEESSPLAGKWTIAESIRALPLAPLAAQTLSREQIELTRNGYMLLAKPFARGEHGNAAFVLNALCDMALQSLGEPPAEREEVATPQWISVKERLPERHQDCIIAFDHNGQLITAHGLLKWNGERWTIGVSDLSYPGRVTHWMPLPQPPKEQEAKKETK